jgi:predicted RecA/RadA family phage recombinase
MGQYESIYESPAGTLDYTPASAVTAGTLVQLPGGKTGHVVADIAASVLGAIYTKGLFRVKCATGVTFSAGAPVYFSAAGRTAIASMAATDDWLIGVCAKTKTSELEVLVEINESPVAGAAVTQTPVVEIDHADTAEFELLSAADNPGGMVLLEFFAELTEASAGASEDQLIITLYDSDDAALSVITAANASADTVGDVIRGTLGVLNTTSGTVMSKVGAGKGCYAKVSQATSGSGMSGKMKVRALLAPLN